MSVPVLIGDREFPSVKAALDRVREALYRYRPGDTVTDLDDISLLNDVVAMHPDAEAKIGPGIDHFEVRLNLRTPGFWIVWTDGGSDNFSFYRAIRPASHRRRVQAAFRRLVADQAAAACDAAFASGGPVLCPILGVVLTPDTCHVDHEDPLFVELADDFAATEGGYEAIDVVSEQGALGQTLVDAGVSKRWQGYHAANAHLRVVSARANLSDLRRKP